MVPQGRRAGICRAPAQPRRHRTENGRGVVQDYVEAVKWYRKAAEQGNAEAQYNLGVMYYKGKGIPQDYILAYMSFNLAASPFPASEKKNRESTVKNPDLVASMITPAQYAEAQRWHGVRTEEGGEEIDIKVREHKGPMLSRVTT